MPAFAVGGNAFQSKRLKLTSVPLTETALEESDCVVVVTGHHGLDYEWIVQLAPLIVDSCNATAKVQQRPSHVLRLGAPA